MAGRAGGVTFIFFGWMKLDQLARERAMSRRYITAQSIQSRVGAHNHAAVVCIEDISGGYRRKRKETRCCWFKQEM